MYRNKGITGNEDTVTCETVDKKDIERSLLLFHSSQLKKKKHLKAECLFSLLPGDDY